MILRSATLAHLKLILQHRREMFRERRGKYRESLGQFESASRRYFASALQAGRYHGLFP